MSLDSTDAGEVPHYAYIVLGFFPPLPTKIAILCHHGETNDVFLLDGRVGPHPFVHENGKSRNLCIGNFDFTD